MTNVSISTINATLEPMSPSKRCAPVVEKYVYAGALEGYMARKIELRTGDWYLAPMMAEPFLGSEEMLSFPITEKTLYSRITDVLWGPEVTKIGNAGYLLSWGIQEYPFVEDGLHVVFARDAIVFEVKKNNTEPETCTVTATCDYPPVMDYFKYLIEEDGIGLVEPKIPTVQTLEELVTALPGEPQSDAWWRALNDAYNDPAILDLIIITHDRIEKLTGISERTLKRKLKKS